MDQGKRWKFPESYFPRYTFFRDHLFDFIPRFQRIVAHGKLENVLVNGTHHLAEINKCSKYFEEHVTVSVFGTSQDLKKNDLVVKLIKEDEAKESSDSTSWSQFVETSRDLSFYDIHIAVYVIRSDKDLQDCNRFTDKLTELQKNNIIVYNIPDKKSYHCGNIASLSSVQSTSASTKGASSFIQTTDGSPKPLCRVIQYALEEKFIAFMEESLVASFIHKLVPKSGKQFETKLDETIGDTLQTKLSKGHIISEFYPRGDTTEREHSEVELPKVVKFIKGVFKGELVELLSRKEGLSTGVVRAFLFDEYGLESEVDKILQEFKPRLKEDDEHCINYCKHVGEQCMKVLTPFVVKTEQFMEEKAVVLELMVQLEFELHGLINISEVPRRDLTIPIPVKPKMIREMFTELVKIPGVESCGYVQGKLTLHLSKANVGDLSIKKVLKKYYCHSDYDYKKVMAVERIEQNGTIGHGHEIRTEVSDRKFNYGSLGCFVKRKGANNNTSICGITCAHCVNDSHRRVDVKVRNDYERLGDVEHSLYEPDRLDIALIKVVDTKIPNCDFTLARSNGMTSASSWRFVDNDPFPVNTPVYINGAASGFKKGVVVCSDEMTRKMAGQGQEPTYTLLIRPKADIGGELFSQAGDSGSVVCMDDPDNSRAVIAGGLLCGALSEKSNGRQTYLYSHASHLRKLLNEVQIREGITITPALP